MWDFHDKSLSIKSPRNLVQSTCFNSVLLILTWVGRTFYFNSVLLKSIEWVFSMLSENLLACIQDWTSLSSLYIVSIRIRGSRCVRNKLESSAKHINERVCEELWRSLIYKMNKSGPKGEPCGTPHEIVFSWESRPFILTNCFRLDK